MMGNGFGMHGLPVLVYLFVALLVLAIVVPLTIVGIRLLNQTWFDPDWRKED